MQGHKEVDTVSKFQFKTSTPKEVRVTLSKLVNLVANGKIGVKEANCITYICNAILQGIRLDSLESEIQELKEIIEKMEAGEYE